MAILNTVIDDSGGSAVQNLTGLLVINPYTVPAGDNKKLSLTFVTKVGAGTPPLASSVTAFGNACTFVESRLEGTGPANRVEVYELNLGSTTPSGDIVASWTSPVAVGVIARTITDVAQQAPEATAVNGANSATSLNTNITTLTANAVIIDGASVANDGTAAITQGPDQVQDAVKAITAGSQLYGFGASHRVGGTAGSHTLGWSSTATGRYIQVLVAYEAAGAGGVTRTVVGGLTAAVATLSGTMTLTGAAKVVTVKMPAPNMAGINWYWFDDVNNAPIDKITDGSGTTDGNRNLSATLPNSVLTSGQTGTMIITSSSGALIGIAYVTVP